MQSSKNYNVLEVHFQVGRSKNPFYIDSSCGFETISENFLSFPLRILSFYNNGEFTDMSTYMFSCTVPHFRAFRIFHFQTRFLEVGNFFVQKLFTTPERIE